LACSERKQGVALSDVGLTELREAVPGLGVRT
jgi:hypothetical protein